MELEGVLLCQPWGMMGKRGIAARLYAKEKKNYIDDQIPFGELIFGGDAFNETYVVTKDQYLIPFFKRLKIAEIGKVAYSNFGRKIPFVVKVISVEIPAPLLCNPNENIASLYHELNPKIFIHSGVRNQLLVALGDFSLLLGFRSLDYIIEVFEKVPEIKHIVDGNLIETFLRTKSDNDFLMIFETLLDTLPAEVEYAGKLLSERLLNTAPSCIAFHPLNLFTKLFKFYPQDIGIFLLYFLNVVKLKNLESIVIPPETPFAYLGGEAIECSNGVENSTKGAFSCRRDVNEFIKSLSIKFLSMEGIKDQLFVDTRSVDDNITEYLTFFSFFRLFMGSLPPDCKQTLPKLNSFSIILILEGKGSINDEVFVNAGSAYFFSAERTLTVNTIEKIVYIQVTVNLL